MGDENVIGVKRWRVGREKLILASLMLEEANLSKLNIKERTFILQKSTVYNSPLSEFVNRSRIKA